MQDPPSYKGHNKFSVRGINLSQQPRVFLQFSCSQTGRISDADWHLHICGTAKTNGSRTHARTHFYPWCKPIDLAWGSRLCSLTTQQRWKKRPLRFSPHLSPSSCPHWLFHFLIVLLKQKKHANTISHQFPSLLYYCVSLLPSSLQIPVQRNLNQR